MNVRSQAGLGNPNLLAGIARAAILGLGIIAAINQVGIASTLVNTLFMGFVGTLALALGLAFGLGGRETAGQIVLSWYSRSKEAAARTAHAMESNQQQMQAQQAAQYRAQGQNPVAPTTRDLPYNPQR